MSDRLSEGRSIRRLLSATSAAALVLGLVAVAPTAASAATGAPEGLNTYSFAGSPKGYGKVQVKNVKLKSAAKYWDALAFVNAKNGKEAASGFAPNSLSKEAVAQLKPGKYRIALQRYTYNARTGKISTKVLGVFGTKSKSVKKGKTVTVRKGKALLADYRTGKVKKQKDFSSKVVLKLRTQIDAGKKLTASLPRLPKGTKVKYQWSFNGKKLKGATKKSYTVKPGQRLGYPQVEVLISKRGYVSGSLGGWSYVRGLKLGLKTDQTIAQSGTTLTVTRAVFNRSTTAYFSWSVNGEYIGNAGETLDVSELPAGTVVAVEGFYFAAGHESATRRSTVTLAESEIE
ncbi:hypothetical protein J4H92_13085 [Leucobacter weissii]|uniref:Uncharacterized protein n=1 Tax=Leucobacter weissii TaxID=1983706 RepID=A0A939MKY0_9MICO|nr:hypothetical protein [Leucobacter weissii]MBO1902879.1 hypothetical protein [Leucobacter weissii]